jgi:hypothetical protein
VAKASVAQLCQLAHREAESHQWRWRRNEISMASLASRKLALATEIININENNQ